MSSVNLKLKEFLDKNNISRYKLSKMTGIEYRVIDNYYKNKVQRYDSYILERVCKVLNCKIEDILEYYPDSNM